MQRLPKHLKNATPEEIQAYRIVTARKARMGAEEGRILFRLRMRREEKEADLDKLIDIYRTQYDKSRRQAICAAQEDLGYLGAEKERKEYIKAEARAMRSARRQKQSECQKRWRRNVRNKALDEVMDTLPANAPPEKELDWVLSHRKLFHAAQSLNDPEPEPVRLDVADIKTAPSQSAVTMLTVALQDPVDWMRKKRDAHKGKTSAGTGGTEDDSIVVDDLSEVERILKAASDQQQNQ